MRNLEIVFRKLRIVIVNASRELSVPGSWRFSPSGSSNNLYFNTSYSATRDDWTLTLDDDGNAFITSVNKTDRFIKWNGASGQERFACYTSSSTNMKPVHLYKLVSNGPSLATKPATGEQYSSFATTINAIEDRTGIDFFANVPVEFQEPAEQTNKQLW